eukprot:TRINITY_DN111184_c0_g1_i1.p2 TRINITY_DN111184_c0_g1~~TRINITY_DN111184_c0_g1_i1.p2  ORF type:complete len:177 (-),score=15.33 TRINITY_DN111184_c0_g1_i1:38-568(-)
MWDVVVKEAGQAVCTLGASRELMDMACSKTASRSEAACAQARSTYDQADSCAREKYELADTCRKVCDMVDGRTHETLRTDLRADCKFLYLLAYAFLIFLAAGRAVPLSLLSIRVCRQRGKFWSVTALDFLGVLDAFMAEKAQEANLTAETEDEVDSVAPSSVRDLDFCCMPEELIA